jgi:pimeloyl-ACP methyl ester carboxylesterase
MSRWLTHITAGIATAAVLGAAGYGFCHQPPDRAGCHTITTTVRLVPASPAPVSVVGELCTPDVGTQTVQLLVHGASYNRSYWSGFGNARYDYTAAVARVGQATLAVDMPGAGQSGHPDPNQVTFTTAGYVLSQLVGQLRDGRLGRYRTVVGVGHSMGAGAWLVEAGTWGGVDRLILADFLHDTNPDGVTAVRFAYRPAPNQPAGYLTVPNRTVFYNTRYVDPAVLAADVSDTFPAGMAATLTTARDPALSKKIRVPVLIVVGQDDTLNCAATLPCTTAAVTARERPRFTAPLTVVVLPRSGHDTNLHPDSPWLFARELDWTARR